MQTRFDDSPLNNRQLLVRHFNPQIAARYHPPVGCLYDFLQIPDGLLILDLGNDQRPEAVSRKEPAQLRQVAGLAHEGESNKIQLQFQAEFYVQNIFGCQRGQTDLDAGEINMAVAAQIFFSQKFAFDLVSILWQPFPFYWWLF